MKKLFKNIAFNVLVQLRLLTYLLALLVNCLFVASVGFIWFINPIVIKLQNLSGLNEIIIWPIYMWLALIVSCIMGYLLLVILVGSTTVRINKRIDKFMSFDEQWNMLWWGAWFKTKNGFLIFIKRSLVALVMPVLFVFLDELLGRGSMRTRATDISGCYVFIIYNIVMVIALLFWMYKSVKEETIEDFAQLFITRIKDGVIHPPQIML